MRGDEADLVALVRALLFQLVRASTGQVIAELMDAINTGGIPPLYVPGLVMHHLEGATWPGDGYLGWSAPNDRDGYPIVRLAGAADAVGNLPFVELQTPGLEATMVHIAATGSGGGAARYAEIDAFGGPTTANVALTAGNDAAPHAFTTLTISPTGLRLDNYTTSRTARMLTGIYNGTQAADVTLTTAFQTTCSVAVTGCVAGDVIHATGTQDLRCTTLSAGVAAVAATGLYDTGGTLLAAGPPAILIATAAGQRVSVPLSQVFDIGADGDYTVRNMVWKSAALGVYVAGVHSMNTVTRFSQQ